MSEQSLDAIDAALAAGRNEDAARAAALIEPANLSSELRAVLASMHQSETALDDVILTVERLLDSGLPPEEALVAHVQRIACYQAKRVRALAEQAIKDAEDDGFAESPELAVARGRLLLSFDERSAAFECYAKAREKQDGHTEAQLAAADLHFVLGEFDAAKGLLLRIVENSERSATIFGQADVPTAAQWARACRILAACHAATADYENEAKNWQHLVEHDPKNESDRINLAFAFAAAGDYSAAERELRAVHDADPDSPRGRYARTRLDHLTSEGSADAPVKRLKQFPTTAQKHNYCGPAVLELCLSYLDMELTQDEIAEVVKREGGTPMYEITAYLEGRNIAARRIEATPERIRAAIDLGLPVIVQEEYSTTAHVAVITGYDSRLGTFIANDPATHRPLFKAFEWTERSGDLFGNGGVLVLGRQGADELAELEKKADDAGLLHEKHLALLDTADRHRHQLESDKGPEVARREILRICDQALDLKGDFRLAWYRKCRALFDLRAMTRTQEAHNDFVDFLHRVRVRFPYDEWTHQMHGHYLDATGRKHEAYAEYLEASRLDSSDSFNKQWMAECKMAGGDLAAAEELFLRALALDPTHERASENIAGLYTQQLRHMALEQAEDDDDAWSAPPKPDEIRTPVERAHDELLARATHFNRVALANNRENAYNHHIAGHLARLRGDLESFIEISKRSVEMAPGQPHARMLLAHAYLDANKNAEALDVAEGMCEKFPEYEEAWLLLAQVHRHAGNHEDAQQTILRGASTCRNNRERFAEPMFQASKAVLGSGEAAGSIVREFAEAHWGESAFMRDAAFLLDGEGQRGHAIALMRHVLEQSPHELQAMYRLGCLLSEDVTTKEEGHALLAKVCEYAPESPVVRQRLAWLYWPHAPQEGLQILEPVLDAGDPMVYEAASALASAAGDDDLADAMRKKALGSYRTEVLAHLNLGWSHIRYNRFELALEHATAAGKLDVSGDDVKEVEDLDYSAHRLGGKIRELHPRAAERCKDEVPEHLAWDVYYAFRGIDPNLAARAAIVVSDSKKNSEDKLEWRSHAAGRFAMAGETALLERIEDEISECAVALASLSWEYLDLARVEDANRVADRAYELDPKNIQVLSAAQEAALRRGNFDLAVQHASRALELHPYQHIGNERLALLYGKQFQVEEALHNSARAVDLAPFCHISLNCRAVSLVVAERLEEAAVYAERSLSVEPPTEENEDNDALKIVRALSGDLAGLEACIEDHLKKHPAELFARYHEHLKGLAAERS